MDNRSFEPICYIACAALLLAGCLAFRTPHERPDYRLGCRAYADEDYEKAAGLLGAHVRKFPQDIEARLMLGHACLRLEQLTEAVNHFKAFTEAAPGAAAEKAQIKQQMFAESDRLASLGRADLSMRYIMAYLNIDPQDVGALILMAEKHLERGDVRNALGFLNRLSVLAPRNPRVAELFDMVSAGFH